MFRLAERLGMTVGQLMQCLSAQEFGQWVALAAMDREREEQRKTAPPDEAAQAAKLREMGFDVTVTE
jgi:hypothetical protein